MVETAPQDTAPQDTTPEDTSTTESGAPETALSTEVMLEERNQRRAAPLDDQTAHLLTRIYLSRRVNYQIQFYQSRIREFDTNSDQMFRLGALVMSLSSLAAAISLQADSATLRLLTALLPAIAALIASFRQLYQWERQAGIYRDTILGLEEARLILPDLDVLDPSTSRQVYPDLVKRAEQVFKDEVNQWGQVAGGKTEDGEDIDAIKAIAEELNLDVFDENGNIDEEKLGLLRDIMAASQDSPQEKISIEHPDAPEPSSLPSGKSAENDDTAP